MSDNKVVAAGKSKEEVAYELMIYLLRNCQNSKDDYSKEEVVNHYLLARCAVTGNSNGVDSMFKCLA